MELVASGRTHVPILVAQLFGWLVFAWMVGFGQRGCFRKVSSEEPLGPESHVGGAGIGVHVVQFDPGTGAVPNSSNSIIG